MALTDHNVISGLGEFNVACNRLGILGIPFGVEIYFDLPDDVMGSDIIAPELIVLGKNPRSLFLEEYLGKLKKYRAEFWLYETLRKLEKIGFKIPAFNLKEQLDNLGSPDIFYSFIEHGRNLDHLVQYIHEREPCASESEIRQKSSKFLNKHVYAPGTPAFVKRIMGFGIDDALSLADAMNCMLFIAHPGGEYGASSDRILDYYIERGIKGIEVRNYFNTSKQNEKFDRLAREKRLVRSGGSDCHGDKGPFKIGMYDRPQNQLPKDILEELWYSLPA